jgi:hypothetical protein
MALKELCSNETSEQPSGIPAMSNRRALLCLLVAPCLSAQDSIEVTRTVRGQIIESKSLPAAKLQFADPFRYVGSKEFELYGVAVAEIHLFVDANSEAEVKRFFWVQFEHYMPDNTRTYTYQLPGATELGPLPFQFDTAVYTDFRGIQPRQGSDTMQMRDLVAKHKLTLPKTAARIRMMHLADSDRRSELMIIYGEAIAADQLPEGATNGMLVDAKDPEWGRRLIKSVNANLKIAR